MEYQDRSDERCQGQRDDGSACTNRARLDSHLCANCFSKSHAKRINKESRRMYDLATYNGDIDRFSKAKEIRSLKEEVGISRMILERILKSIDPKNIAMMLARFPQINQSIKTIESLVVQCNKFDITAGQMLDKADVARLSSEIVKIVAEEIEDQVTLERIADRVAKLFEEQETSSPWL